MRAAGLLVLLGTWLCGLLALPVVQSKVASGHSLVTGVQSRLRLVKDGAIVASGKQQVEGAKQRGGPNPPSQSEIWSAVALVTGTTVGAGVLALPQSTAAAGFVPSSLVLVGAWIFMAATGLLFAEISTNLAKSSPSDQGLGILAMTERLLGKAGALPAGTAYVFIHFALLVAYIAGAGDVLSKAFHLPQLAGPLLFTAVVGSVLTFGSDKQVDRFNNAWVLSVVVSFCGLMGLALPSVNLSHLAHSNFSAVLSSVPVMLVALVYHNVVPAICQQLRYDKDAITKTVLLGSAFPLLMFILWNGAILGIISPSASDAAAVSDPLASLRDNERFSLLVDVFSESAIITSFTGFVIGLLGFFQDVLRPAKSAASHKPADVAPAPPAKASLALYAAVLLPPTVVAIAAPDCFNAALDFAGAYGITVLFGILPIIMAWLQRAQRGVLQETFVPGGPAVLGALLLVVSSVVLGKIFAFM